MFSKIEDVRNIGILAHIDAGKTTTTERILYYSHVIHRIGEVDEGLATMDYMDLEREKGITITSATTSFSWLDKEIHLIDTPGHVDFTIEVERSLRILDGAVIIFSAVEGVETQSEKVWHQADRYQVPRVVYVNKLDRTGADFFSVLEQMQQKFSGTFLPLQLPIRDDAGVFTGIIDLIQNQALYFSAADEGLTVTMADIPQAQQEQAADYREQLLEFVSERDDLLLEKYLDGQALTREEIVTVLRAACIANECYPVLLGSSLKNIGVQPLMDAIVDYLPAPIQRKELIGTHPRKKKRLVWQPNRNSHFSAVVFKITIDKTGLPLCYTRIYSGKVSVGDRVYNPTQEVSERINKLYLMHSNKKKEINTAEAGMIVGIRGPRHIQTGETICKKDHPILYASMLFPEPVISVAVEPRSSTDYKKFMQIMEDLQLEDPSLKVRKAVDTGQTLLSGMGELHLDIVLERVEREFNLAIRRGNPQVAYKETATKEVLQKAVFEKTIGAEELYFSLTARISPLEQGGGFSFCTEVKTKDLPDWLIPEIEQTLRLSVQSGVVAGYPVIDVGFTLTAIDPGNDKFSEIAVRGATAGLVLNGLRAADCVLLEPIMDVELMIPLEDVGGVVASVNSRNGRVIHMEQRGAFQIINAEIALSNMFGYSTHLRSLTRGKCTFAMMLKHYAPIK